ncbi:MAG: cyclophilin-like superfamily protein [Rhodospirillaceae bacterium]|nr:cyclophilin-like superfamily protein [Rhodospirillaceae bacterium]
MTNLIVLAGPYRFEAHLEAAKAPETCEAFSRTLPFVTKIVHVRWSGEAVWAPLGDMEFGVGFENHTSYPSPGQVILYPGGFSETEILLAYGGVNFASKMGQLAGNHFLTFTSGLEKLAALGTLTLWEGAQDIQFNVAE